MSARTVNFRGANSAERIPRSVLAVMRRVVCQRHRGATGCMRCACSSSRPCRRADYVGPDAVRMSVQAVPSSRRIKFNFDPANKRALPPSSGAHHMRCARRQACIQRAMLRPTVNHAVCKALPVTNPDGSASDRVGPSMEPVAGLFAEMPVYGSIPSLAISSTATRLRGHRRTRAQLSSSMVPKYWRWRQVSLSWECIHVAAYMSPDRRAIVSCSRRTRGGLRVRPGRFATRHPASRASQNRPESLLRHDAAARLRLNQDSGSVMAVH